MYIYKDSIYMYVYISQAQSRASIHFKCALVRSWILLAGKEDQPCEKQARCLFFWLEAERRPIPVRFSYILRRGQAIGKNFSNHRAIFQLQRTLSVLQKRRWGISLQQTVVIYSLDVPTSPHYLTRTVDHKSWRTSLRSSYNNPRGRYAR